MPTVKHPTLIAALTKVIGSKPYAPIKLMYRQDHKKLLEEMQGNRRPTAGSLFFQGLIEVARFAYVTPVTPPPVKPPDPPITSIRMEAPQTINPEGGSDARYCVRDLPIRDGRPYEPSNPNIMYDMDGLCLGGRTNDRVIPGLRGARSVDGADYCGYDYQGVSYPPWPKESYLP